MSIVRVDLNTDLLQLPELFEKFMNKRNIVSLGKEVKMNLKKVYADADTLFCKDEYAGRLVAIKYQPASESFYIFATENVKSVISISSNLNDEHTKHISLINRYKTHSIHFIGVDVSFWRMNNNIDRGIASSFTVVA